MDALLQLGWQGWLSLALVVGCFGMFVGTRVAPDIVTTAALTLLLVTGVLTTDEALTGFANEGMLTVGVLYVVVTGLTETGAVDWIGQGVLGRPRGETDARLRVMLPVTFLSPFLNNTPVVAIFIPAVQDWAKRYRLELSRLLIPLSYATIAAGTVTLIGTSTNLVVNSLYTGADGWGRARVLRAGLDRSPDHPGRARLSAHGRPLAPAPSPPGRRQLRRRAPVHLGDAGPARKSPGGQEHRGGGAASAPGALPGGDRACWPGPARGLRRRDPARGRPPGLRRHPGLRPGPPAHPRAHPRYGPGLQARHAPPRARLRGGRPLGQVPHRRPERARGPFPQPLRRRHHRPGAQRRAGRPQDRRHRARRRRHPTLRDPTGLRRAAKELPGLPARQPHRRQPPRAPRAGTARHRNRGSHGCRCDLRLAQHAGGVHCSPLGS